MSYYNLLSYYPTYAVLDEVLTSGNYDTINLYFDIKNNLQSLYMQHAILNIVESSLLSSFIDTSIFESIIHFLSFHKIYAASRKIKVNFFIFFESGTSNYHLNICKKYKISRRIDDLYGLDREKRDLFFNIFQKNLMLLESACNKMPNIKVIRLPNLEADFVPYYLITRKLVNVSSNNCHVIYSNDHDLLQCLNDNTFVYIKVPKSKKLVKKGQALKTYLKFSDEYPDEYLPLSMSVIGDVGDDVCGVKGIGGKTLEKILNEIVSLTGGIDNLYDNVYNEKPIFDTSLNKNLNKYTYKIIEKEENEKLISNNLKLTSFEVLSKFLENATSTEMIEKRKIIENVINQNTVIDIKIMKEALEKNRIYFQDDALDNVYYLGGS